VSPGTYDRPQVDPELILPVPALHETPYRPVFSPLPGLPHGQSTVEVEHQNPERVLDRRPDRDLPLDALTGRGHRHVQVVVKYVVGRLLGGATARPSPVPA
jgi:hypothetical protein